MSSEHDGSIQKCRTEGPQRFACLCNVMYKKCGNLGMFKSVCDEVLLNLRNSFTVMRWCSFKHTLAQNNLCEFWCGMHLTCKNTPVIPDRNGFMKEPEKVSKSFHCQNMTECGNCTFNEVTSRGVSFQKVNFVEGSTCRFLADRLPFREMIKRCRYAELIRLCITTNWQCLRWAASVSRALPPCNDC